MGFGGIIDEVHATSTRTTTAPAPAPAAIRAGGVHGNTASPNSTQNPNSVNEAAPTANQRPDRLNGLSPRRCTRLYLPISGARTGIQIIK